MLKIINTKILFSGITLLAAAALIIGATFAFFSDTETSEGNVLAAGAIDLRIDNESYMTDPITGRLIASPNTSWELTDLTVERFFDFRDLKPGDIGEDTISLHVNNNDAWLCAAARVTDDSDQTCTEPELGDDPTCTNPGLGQGELDSQVNFAFWADDGDNVLETDETEGIFLEGPISGLGAAGQIALADSENNIWTDLNDDPVTGAQDYFIGKAWCFGDLNRSPLPALDGEDEPINSSPLVRGTGFTCDGASGANNAAQTDRVMADLQFFAVQSRNNAEFLCDDDYTPVWPTPTVTPTGTPT